MTNRNVHFINTITGAVADLKDKAFFHGGGKTYPGAVRPFGAVQLSPDTITGGDNGPGYNYHHSTIEGFSFTHMSGIGWYGDLGNLQVMPTRGEMRFHSGSNEHDLYQSDSEGWRSAYQHETEVTKAGYYAVTLDTYKIRAEMTAAERSGMLRFTFLPGFGGADGSDGRIQIDLARRVGGRSVRQFIRIVDDSTIEGWIHCTPEGGGFGHGKGNVEYTLYFYGKFNVPWKSYGVWNLGEDWEEKTEAEAEDLGFYAHFDPGTILFKAGISYVNIDGARTNLETELGHWDFERARTEAEAAWENAIGCISVEGGMDDKKEVFYSALYHTLLDPRIGSDSDGKYYGADKTIHSSRQFTFRTLFSGWDVFRSEFPLLTLIRPDVVNDEINSLIEMARDLKTTFPRWELLGNETGCMIGDPGVVVTVDAYRKGIRGYDVSAAYDICKQTALGPVTTRKSAEAYNTLGYVPERISDTLENVFADWCIFVFAEELGDREMAAQFRQRSQNYRNIYDPSVGWMRRKDSQGNWMEFAGKYDKKGCVESNVFQQTWFVPHDVDGLISLMGRERFIQELELLFERADLSALWNEDYNHSNEPCHHVPHLFNRVGQPWRTQYWVRRIQKETYRTGPFGYCGNEDVGQMSAWFVITAMGFHQLTPGSNQFELNTPLFSRFTLALNPTYHTCTVLDRLVIETDCDPDENGYIQSVSLNGKPIEHTWLTYEEIIAGGVLHFELGNSPNYIWGVHGDLLTRLNNRSRSSFRPAY